MQHKVRILTAARLRARMGDDGRAGVSDREPHVRELEMPHPPSEVLTRRVDGEGREGAADHLIPEFNPPGTGYPIRAEGPDGSGNAATFGNVHRISSTLLGWTDVLGR